MKLFDKIMGKKTKTENVAEVAVKQPLENKLNVKLKKLDPRAVIPTYAHNGDVGMDMVAISVDYDSENDMYIYHTGLAFESEFNVGQFLFARSSNSRTDCYLCNGVGIADSAIYRGEIQFRYKNRDSLKTYKSIRGQEEYRNAFLAALSRMCYSAKPLQQILFSAMDEAAKHRQSVELEIEQGAKQLLHAPYKVGEKVGQMVFLNYPTVEIEVVDTLSETERGDGGFGSTGK